jgi:hypothetical protein
MRLGEEMAGIVAGRHLPQDAVVRCYYVLVHGRLEWSQGARWQDDESEGERPLGFYCHRYVLASSIDEARSKAFERVRQNFEREMGWTGAGLAGLELEAEEISTAPMHKVLIPGNRGHAFYIDE